MASLDSLPADQRAVLQLVLQRGRSYDDIAKLLSIDRAAVRERALSAFEALAPGTRVPAERRALITDYLLGQLPERVAGETYTRLAESPGERAWARVVASEISELGSDTIPEIPVEGAREAEVQAPVPPPERHPEAADVPEQAGEPAAASGRRAAAAPVAASTASRGAASTPADGPADQPPGAGRPAGGPNRPISRRGGAILLTGAALLIAAIVFAISSLSGGSSKSSSSTAASASASTTSTTASTQAATGTPRPIAQVNLTSPTAGSKTKGAAVVVRQGTTTAIELVATAVPPNTTHDAYAVWLYNSSSDARLLGFVNPPVKKNGVLRTLGPLPAGASHFRQLLVTRETQAKPKGPGTIVLQGSLSLTT